MRSHRFPFPAAILLGVLLALTPACPLTAARAQSGGAWKPAPAPLMTRWAKDVSPERVRPEYPRPLLVRKEWKSLNGLWEFAFDDANAGRAAGWSSGKALPQQILVPFTFESALSGIGKGKEVHERVWYRRTFDVPKNWSGKRVLLNLGAVDWESTVWVNGREMGTHRGGYAPFSYDITDALKPGNGPQEIVVAVHDPADPKKGAYQPKGKQLGSEGIWYTRTTGIWQSVWLEPVNRTHLKSLRVDADPERGMLTFQVAADIAGSGGKLSADVTGPDGKKAASGTVSLSPGATHTARLPVRSPQLWSPESPALYQVSLTLTDANGGTDAVQTYTAFRTYGIRNGRLTLNGRPYFLRGVLDQGYWPDGILTPPTDEAIRYDVEMTKKLGFNMSRKHVKVEDPRWYYWCDKLGLAVWQDMPSSHNLGSAEAKQNFTNEWKAVVEAVRGYPSVVHWIPFNENWGDPKEFQDEMVMLTRQLDPTRPITDASGWTQRGLTDVIDAHDYGNSLLRQGVERPVKPKVVGEYGGIALPVEGHTWTTGWGYQTARDPEGLLRRIRFQTTQLFEAANLSGFVYTQLTDVEQEMNGLLTYDRLPKTAPEKFGAIFTGKDRADFGGYVRDWIVLGPLETNTRIHSGTDGPENRAVMDKILAQPFLENEATMKPTDNLLVVAVNGNQFAWHLVRSSDDILDFNKFFGEAKTNAVAYAVAYVNSPTELKNVTLRFGSDDAARVWLNGTQVWSVNRVRGVGLDEDEIRNLTLKAGQNVLVVKVAQGIGGWGLAARFEKSDGTFLKPTPSKEAPLP